ncbi:CRISP/Allergen/PR-1 [Tribolium castaneum]|uniref:CRISP/Allergen/PR-1 n=1 Tax=Tribolium castaneum TaxID=7070 RepID=UPI0030FE23BC
MFQSILLITMYLSYTHAQGTIPPHLNENFQPKEEDPSKNDYCSMYCGRVQHTGCDCKLGPGRQEQLARKGAAGLRAGIVEYHNHLRNLVANGSDTRGKAGKAANMMAISYNLELEYLARCFLRSRFIGHQDECRTMANGRKLGQNSGGFDQIDDSDKIIYKLIERWYEEIMEMTPSIFRKFKIERRVGHFTTMAWGDVNAIGCGRVIVRNPLTLKFLYPSFESIFLCNYGSTLPGNNKQFGVNIIGRPVYLPGEPCTLCPKDYPCNKGYKALCGEVSAPPTAVEYDFALVDYAPQSPKVKPFKDPPKPKPKPKTKAKPKTKTKTKTKTKPKPKTKTKAKTKTKKTKTKQKQKPKPTPKKGKYAPGKPPYNKPKIEEDDDKKSSPKKKSRKKSKKPDLDDPDNRSIKEGTSLVMICSMSLLIVYFVY